MAELARWFSDLNRYVKFIAGFIVAMSVITGTVSATVVMTKKEIKKEIIRTVEPIIETKIDEAVKKEHENLVLLLNTIKTTLSEVAKDSKFTKAQYIKGIVRQVNKQAGKIKVCPEDVKFSDVEAVVDDFVLIEHPSQTLKMNYEIIQDYYRNNK